MSVKTQLVQAIEKSETQAEHGLERYFSTVSTAVERTSKALAKLPAGDKISVKYSELATKATLAQKDALHKLVQAPAKLRSARTSTPAA
jgi:hypothetical protein